MKAHTKGPWRVVRANPSPTSGEWMIAGATPGYFAEVRDCGSGDIQANARLIAAAPELLELLVQSQESIGGDWRERRDALIAKATGAAPSTPSQKADA